MGLKLKDKFFDTFFPNKVERIETRQIEIQPTTTHTTTSQEYSINDNALLLTLRLSQLLGILPISIKKRTSMIYYISISPVLYVINILICLFINGISFYGFFLLLTKENHEIIRSTHTRFEETYSFIKLIIAMCLSFVNILNTFYGIIRVKGNLDSLECIKKIKQTINNGSIQCLENRRKMCSIIIFVTFSPLIINLTAIGFTWKFSDFFSFMTVIVSLTGVLLDANFLLMVEYLNSSFEEINKQLNEILSQLNFYYIERTHRKKISLRIHHLMISFVKSCNMLKKINSNEKLLLFFNVTLFPLYIICNWYSLYHSLLNIEDAALISVSHEAFYCFYNLFVLCLIIQPCQQTQKKVNDTKHLVAEIMCHIQSEDDPLSNSVDTFYKQLLLNHYTFTVMGFWDIEIPLFSKIFGLAFSLLMIMKF